MEHPLTWLFVWPSEAKPEQGAELGKTEARLLEICCLPPVWF